MKANKLHRIFAYGSNMHLGDLGRWMHEHGFQAPGVESVIPALLEDHRLGWNYASRARGAGAANPIPSPGRQFPGVILEIDERTFAAIDHKEGHPHRYCRGEIQESVTLFTGESILAWVYRVIKDHLKEEPIWPSKAYLQLMIEAAREYELPQWYQEELVNTPTV